MAKNYFTRLFSYSVLHSAHMKSTLLALLFIFVGCCGKISSPPVTNATPQQFYQPKIGEVWTFVNAYGDTTTITQEMPGPGSSVLPGDVVWHYQKSNARAYWTPLDATAELWFGLRKTADGWSSFHQLIKCSLCIAGHAEGTVDIVASRGGYLIVPSGPGINVNSTYQPYWQMDVLTWQSGINQAAPDATPWRTVSYMESIVTPVFSGSALVSEQWENCPSVCVHEKWYFAPNIGLVRIEQLALASATDNADPKLYMDRLP